MYSLYVQSAVSTINSLNTSVGSAHACKLAGSMHLNVTPFYFAVSLNASFHLMMVLYSAGRWRAQYNMQEMIK